MALSSPLVMNKPMSLLSLRDKPKSLLSLPKDCIEPILEYLGGSGHNSKAPAILPLLTVCKALHNIALPYFWKDLVVGPCAILEIYQTTRKKPHLLSHVKHFCVRLVGDHDDLELLMDARLAIELMLLHCPRLEVLHLTTDTIAPSHDVDAGYPLLRKAIAGMSELREFCWSHHELCEDAGAETIMRLKDLFTALSFTKVETMRLENRADDPQHCLSSSQQALEHLTVLFMSEMELSQAEWVAVSELCPQLESLTLQYEAEEATIETLECLEGAIDEQGAFTTLLCLSIDAVNCSSLDFSRWLASCPKLQELTLWTKSMLDSPDIEWIPSTIETITVGFTGPFAAAGFLKGVVNGSWPNLQALVLCEGTWLGCQLFRDLKKDNVFKMPMLRYQCKQQGIPFVLHTLDCMSSGCYDGAGISLPRSMTRPQ